MTASNDFDAGRDHDLGTRLRAHFETTDDAAFTARILSRIGGETRESSWDVLARWAPLGVAAAAILALAAGLGLGMAWNASTASAPDTADPVVWLSTGQPVTSEFVLTAALTEPGMSGEQR
jgi:hypothetical protein